MKSRSILVATLWLAAFAPGQVVDGERASAVLGCLAADRLAGRDSPSPGLEEAARYLAEAFAAAGLEPGVPGDEPSWFHRYELPGLAVAEGGELVAVHGAERQPLVIGEDFRVWEAGRAFEASAVALPEPAAAGASRAQRSALAGRSLRLVVVGEDDPAWAAAAGQRVVLSRRAPAAAPVVLLREGSFAEDARFDCRLPAAREVSVPLRNVVGLLRGSDLADEFVVVSAHYDHVGVRPRADGGDSVYNGADDNATGTTAVVCLAAAFAARDERPRRSILFVCFSAEEKGLRGSRAFCESPPVPLDRIVAVVNLEMLGRPDDRGHPYAWITGAELSDFAAIARGPLEDRGVQLAEFELASRLFRASDNYPFAQQGIVAHSISAGTLHADYHQPGDEIGRIEIEHLTAVTGGIAAVVAELASRDAAPRYHDGVRERLMR